MEITEKESKILKHSLGLKSNNKEYRNYFFTGVGTSDYPHCESLVTKGLMVRRRNNLNEIDVEYIYHVTEKGRKVIR